jgi:hypothetical protein
MAYTYHGTTDLIALPNRTVQTYPSGLVRVERSFVCRKDLAARFRNTIKVNELMPFDDGAPAIDGLYIFPEPQETARDDGFVEFRVTAYGRTNTTGNIEISLARNLFSVYRQSIYEGIGYTYAIFPNYVQKIVLKSEEIDRGFFELNADPKIISVAMFVIQNILDQGRVSEVYVPFDFWKNYVKLNPKDPGILYNGALLFSGIGVGIPIPYGATFTETPIFRHINAENSTSTSFGVFSEYSISYKTNFNGDFRNIA